MGSGFSLSDFARSRQASFGRFSQFETGRTGSDQIDACHSRGGVVVFGIHSDSRPQ